MKVTKESAHFSVRLKSTEEEEPAKHDWNTGGDAYRTTQADGTAEQMEFGAEKYRR